MPHLNARAGELRGGSKRDREGFPEEGRLELSLERFGKLRKKRAAGVVVGRQDKGGDWGLAGAAEEAGWEAWIFEQKRDKFRFAC